MFSDSLLLTFYLEIPDVVKSHYISKVTCLKQVCESFLLRENTVTLVVKDSSESVLVDLVESNNL